MTTAADVRQQSQTLATLATQITTHEGQLSSVTQTKAALVDLVATLRDVKAIGDPLATKRAKVAQLTKVRDALKAGGST